MINIAIDGHVGSGKSTLAKGLAKRLGFYVFDTGAIYRGIACEYMSRNLGEPNEEIINDFIKTFEVKVKFIDDVEHVFVNGKDWTPNLRLEQTSVMAGKISPYPKLRDKVLSSQRDFAKTHDVVMEGRDIGTRVLPNADFKFFVTASEEVRAGRRFDQIKGTANAPTYEQILQDLRDRDYRDEHREVAALRPAEDGIIIDSSNQTLEETIEKCLQIINERAWFFVIYKKYT